MKEREKSREQLIREIEALKNKISGLDNNSEIGEGADYEACQRVLREFTETLPETIFEIDTNGMFKFVNKTGLDMFGYTQEELNKGINVLQVIAPEERDRVRYNIENAMKSGKVSYDHEYIAIKKDGTTMPVMIKTTTIKKNGKPCGLRGFLIDISDRKKIEKELKISETKYKEVADLLPQTVYEMDIEGKLVFVNRHAYEAFGYTKEDFKKGLSGTDMLAPEDRERAAKNIKIIFGGKNTGSHEYTAIRKDGTQFPVIVTSTVIIRENKPAGLRGIIVDITERKEVEKALRKAKDDLEVKVEQRTSELRVSNEQLIKEIDVRSRTENALQKSFEKLQRILEETVSALASSVEKRDPYTAGHQQRVAQLAMAIAETMNLPEEKINGIHIASVVHDIGKISVPAEILSKPGKLSDIERDMIKIHTRVGFDILKMIEFPWPVDKIVLQHHERIDGSGYPTGLGKDQILLEAKILAVADVVEAMASHRPYRSALGVEKALEEITINRGKLYDTEVVNACLSLFRGKKFRFQAVKNQ